MSEKPKTTDLAFRDFDFREAVDSERMASRAEGDDRIAIAISSEAGVERYDWAKDERYNEVLDHGPESVDLSYAKDGLPLLMDHDPRRQVGLIEDVRVGPDRKLRGLVRFSRGRAGQDARKDMEDGIRQKISVGYRLDQYTTDERAEGTIPTRRYTRWTPMEGSSVAIPADYAVGVGRSAVQDAAPNTSPTLQAPQRGQESRSMSTSNAPDGALTVTDNGPSERTRAAEIMALAAEHAVTERAQAWISGGASVESVQKEIMSVLRERLKTPVKSGGASVELTPKEQRQYSYARALAYAAGMDVDAGFEREIEQELAKKLPADYARKGGALIPTSLATRAGLDSIASTKGPELKFTQPGEFIELLRARMKAVAMGVRVLSGLTGPVSFPKQTAAASGSWVAENSLSDVADSNLLLSTVSLAIKTYQASTSFSRQLLVSAISASVDAEQLVREDLAAINARAVDLAIINGSGASNQPRGILNTSGIGSVAIGANGGAPTFEHLVDLESAVATANADVESMGYLTTPGIRGKLKKSQMFSGTNGIPVWYGGNAPLNGYRAEVSTQVPSTLTKGASTDCHAILFGDFSQALLGEWGTVEVIVDPFRLKKQGMIEVTTFLMADVAVRQAAAFAAILDARTV